MPDRGFWFSSVVLNYCVYLCLYVCSTLNSGAYIYRGKARFGTNKIEAAEGEFVEFNNDGDKITVEVGEGGAKFILLAGQPLNEPIAKHGPFVMNTREEIRQAFVDYSEGKLVRCDEDLTFPIA